MAKKTSKKNQLDVLKKQLMDVVQDRKQLEISVVLTLVAIASLAIFLPLSSKTDETAFALKKQEERKTFTEDIERLRHTYKDYLEIVSTDADINWWLQHILKGTRLNPLKVRSLEHKVLRTKIDKHKAMIVQLEVEGDFEQTFKLIRWLEHQHPFILVSRIRAMRGPESIVTNIELSMLTSQGKNKTNSKRKTKKKQDQAKHLKHSNKRLASQRLNGESYGS